MAGTNGSENTRKAKAYVTYVKTDGTVVNFPTPDASIVRTTFANDVTRDFDVSSLKDDMRACAVLQGVAIRTQRSYQAEKDLDACIANYDDVVSNLGEGVWVSFGGEGGAPRVTMLATAVKMALEKAGQEVDDARFASIIEKLKTEDGATKANANPQVKIFLADLRAAAAKERAAELKKAQKASGAVAEVVEGF